jgi:hypothetical protein
LPIISLRKKEIISQLQDIGLNVLAFVCDQGPTNCAALRELCDQRHPRQTSYIFFLCKDKQIVAIFHVPHLLKNTRNALLKCKIQFVPHKRAKFHHIEPVFDFDQQKHSNLYRNEKKPHFNLKNEPYMKMKVATGQLSISMASAMETLTKRKLAEKAKYDKELMHIMEMKRREKVTLLKRDNAIKQING